MLLYKKLADLNIDSGKAFSHLELFVGLVVRPARVVTPWGAKPGS